jgi:hypothetical protein
MHLAARFGYAAVLFSLMLVGQAAAQLPTAPQPGGTTQQPTLSDEQIRDVLMLRALQSRGSRGGGQRGVQRGVPQFVPYGNPWFMGTPMNAQQPDSKDSKTSEARSARIERLRQAREEAVAKREEAAQRRAKARAEAQAKAAAKAKVKD